jgi:hypothetical protein
VAAARGSWHVGPGLRPDPGRDSPSSARHGFRRSQPERAGCGAAATPRSGRGCRPVTESLRSPELGGRKRCNPAWLSLSCDLAGRGCGRCAWAPITLDSVTYRAAGALAATASLVTILTIALDRPRPPADVVVGVPLSTDGFPSGHTANGSLPFVPTASMLALTFGRFLVRWLLMIGGALLIGSSRAAAPGPGAQHQINPEIARHSARRQSATPIIAEY